jgi:hypothetical protein
MNRLLVAFVVAVSFAWLIPSCTCKRSDNKDNKGKSIGFGGLGKDGPAPAVQIKIDRFEKDLFALNVDSLEPGIKALKKKYGEFFEMFNYKMVGLGDCSTPEYKEDLSRFLTDYYQNLNYKKVKQVYPDINGLTKELSDAFTNYRSAFPEKKIPHIYTCISGWNQSVVTSDTLIGISLDKYLGRDCEFYKQLQIDRYACYTLQREYITPDCMRLWGYTEFPFDDKQCNSVLCNMLYEGKIMYFVKQMLPETQDSILFGYKSKQLKWCKESTKAMWTYLVENKMLFSTKYMDIRKLIYPAPFTSFFPKESPGRAVVWLGYQIVDAYMQKNDDVTLAQLMAESDYQKILRKANFKP